jgi:hypothetical protein
LLNILKFLSHFSLNFIRMQQSRTNLKQMKMKKQMKNFLYATLLVTLVFTAGVSPQNKTAPVKYDTYDRYFVRNDANLKGNPSYLVFKTQKQFDSIFGPAAINGENKFLPENAFDTMIVVTTIKRGDSIRDYSIKEITGEKDNLIITYEAEDRQSKGGSWVVPLIISVDKAKYKKVVFRENWGKPTQKSVTVKIK